MKSWTRLFLIASVAMVGGATRAQAQTYSIDWFKVSGGGGASSNGLVSLTGTIGQQDAGNAMTNGGYSLVGGFWALVAVQIPGSPILSIFLTSPNTAVVAWSAPATGFVLQQNIDLTTTNWAPVTGPTNVVGAQNQVVFPSPAGNRFFRLVNP